ncbi:MAG: PIG-L deacetylase family protein [Saprospiraceae bacterium]
MFKGKRILVLAPHTDDGELGCGGSIAKFVESGSEVYYAAFSTADDSVPPEFPRNQLEIEVREATRILGIPPGHLIVFNYQVRKLNYVRQEVLEEMVQINQRLQPDLVFLPSSKDIHQDHITITREGIRAFKYCSILGYELIWNNLSFSTDCFIEITRLHLDKKVAALKAYVTQQEKSYMQPAFIESLARVRGGQVGVDFAETFEVIRWLIR